MAGKQTLAHQCHHGRHAIGADCDVIAQSAQHLGMIRLQPDLLLRLAQAAASGEASPGSIRPPGKLTCPEWCRKCSVRLVSNMPGAGPVTIPTSTAAAARPGPSGSSLSGVTDAASAGSGPVNRARNCAGVTPRQWGRGRLTRRTRRNSTRRASAVRLRSPARPPPPARNRPAARYAPPGAPALAVADVDVGHRLAGQRVMGHAQRVLRAGGHHLVHIGAE